MQEVDVVSISPPALDLEASPVPGQLASVVLALDNGEIVRGALPNAADAIFLYQIFVEAGNLDLLDFKRMTVTLSPIRYVVSRDDTHVYIVQTRAG